MITIGISFAKEEWMKDGNQRTNALFSFFVGRGLERSKSVGLPAAGPLRWGSGELLREEAALSRPYDRLLRKSAL